MKKAYSRPKVYIESFELLEHIASCTSNPSITQVTYRDPHSCSYNDRNVHLYYSEVSSCSDNEQTFDREAAETFEEYIASFGVPGGGCYNTFADGNFFAS